MIEFLNFVLIQLKERKYKVHFKTIFFLNFEIILDLKLQKWYKELKYTLHSAFPNVNNFYQPEHNVQNQEIQQWYNTMN